MKYSEYLEKYFPEAMGSSKLFEKIEENTRDSYIFYCEYVLKISPDYS